VKIAIGLLLGLLLGLGIGVVCRLTGVPLPAPPVLVGALLVLAMTTGYLLVVAMTLGFLGTDYALRLATVTP